MLLLNPAFVLFFPSPSQGQRGTPFTRREQKLLKGDPERQTSTLFCTLLHGLSKTTGVCIPQRQPTFVMTARARTHRHSATWRRSTPSAVEGAGRSGRQSLQSWSSYRASPWNYHRGCHLTGGLFSPGKAHKETRKRVRSFKDLSIFTNKVLLYSE